MENNKKSVLSKGENSMVEPFESVLQDNNDNKIRFQFWVHPNVIDRVTSIYQSDNCASRCEFIEKAVNFYIGYLNRNENIDYLSPHMKSLINSMTAGMETRINRNLFKIAVELGKISNILAAVNEIDEDTMSKLQAMVVNEVRHINGTISYESAVAFQKSE